MPTQKKYKLYASVIQPVPQNIKFSFIAPFSRHLLVYSNFLPKGDNPFVEIPAKVKLSKEEQLWLDSCKAELAYAEQKKDEEKYLNQFNDFLTRCNYELQIEKNKLNQETAN